MEKLYSNEIVSISDNELRELLTIVPLEKLAVDNILVELLRRNIEPCISIQKFLCKINRIGIYKDRATRALIKFYSLFHPSVETLSKNEQLTSWPGAKYDLKNVAYAFINKVFDDHYYEFCKALVIALSRALKNPKYKCSSTLQVLEDFQCIMGKLKKHEYPRTLVKLKHLQNKLPYNNESFMFLVRNNGVARYFEFIIQRYKTKTSDFDHISGLIEECDARWNSHRGLNGTIKMPEILESDLKPRDVLELRHTDRNVNTDFFHEMDKIEISPACESSLRWYEYRKYSS